MARLGPSRVMASAGLAHLLLLLLWLLLLLLRWLRLRWRWLRTAATSGELMLDV